MTDLSTLERLAREATPFCGCQMVVSMMTTNASTTHTPSAIVQSSNPMEVRQCEFHRSCSTDTILALVAILKAVEAQGHGAKKEDCCVSAEYGDCEICAAYNALTPSE